MKFRERIIIPRTRVVFIGIFLTEYLEPGTVNVLYYNSTGYIVVENFQRWGVLTFEDWGHLISIDEFDKIHALFTSNYKSDVLLANSILKPYLKELKAITLKRKPCD